MRVLYVSAQTCSTVIDVNASKECSTGVDGILEADILRLARESQSLSSRNERTRTENGRNGTGNERMWGTECLLKSGNVRRKQEREEGSLRKFGEEVRSR